MNVDQAIEALQTIKKVTPEAGTYEIADDYGEEALTGFRTSTYDENGTIVEYVAFETEPGDE